MKKYEYTAKTYDDAVSQALSDLKVAEENLIINILKIDSLNALIF